MEEQNQIRVASIDILRALTMVFMIWVNDLGSLKGIPRWLEHMPGNYDGMGFSDIIFPSFLVIVGMSIPYAVLNRRKRCDGNRKIAFHIIKRSFALIIMGLFLVNGENIREHGTGMIRVVWYSLSCLAFILIWNVYPKTANKKLVYISQIVGVIILVVLSYLYRGRGDAHTLVRFSIYWWGILGLIGWAYMISAVVYVFSKDKIWVIASSWILFNLLMIFHHANIITTSGITEIIASAIQWGAMPSFVLGGTLASMIFSHYRAQNKNKELTITILGFSVVAFLIGIFLRPFWGISKIGATPSWVLICTAITLTTFVLVYWLTDVFGKADWFNFIKPAGTDTLLTYLLPYFAYSAVILSGISLPAFLLYGGVGLLKSMIFSLLMVLVAGQLSKAGIKLKL